MKVENAVYPNEAQMAQFSDPGPNGPIYMVNLLKYKEKAEYADGRETDLSGREAYAIYGQAVSELIQEFGGDVEFSAKGRASLSVKSMSSGMMWPLPAILIALLCWR